MAEMTITGYRVSSEGKETRYILFEISDSFLPGSERFHYAYGPAVPEGAQQVTWHSMYLVTTAKAVESILANEQGAPFELGGVRILYHTRYDQDSLFPDHFQLIDGIDSIVAAVLQLQKTRFEIRQLQKRELMEIAAVNLAQQSLHRRRSDG